MDCLYPNKTPGRAHRLGCRCDRCRSYDSTRRMVWRQKPENREKDRAAMRKVNKNPRRVAVRNALKSARRVKCQEDTKNLSPEELDKIYKIYERCRLISEATGIKHHVDHIMPLSKGGLHHPDNLQILTAEENLKKGDRIQPGQGTEGFVK